MLLWSFLCQVVSNSGTARRNFVRLAVLQLTLAIGLAQAQTELIVDNVAPAFSVTGTWPASTAVSGYLGADYQTHEANGQPPGGIVVDNTDPGFSVTGTWTASTAIAGYLGANYQHHFANGEPPTAIVADNSSGSATGSWPASTSVAGYYGANYQTHVAGTGASVFTWTLNLPAAGTYEAYARWTSHPNRATNAKYTVNHAGGATVVQVNQEANSGVWVLLGTYSFGAGNATVSLSDEANEYVIADAVMLVPPGAAPSTATWTLAVPATGTYGVYARWTAHPNRATDAKYTVNHAGGAATVTANQEQNSGSWNLLGSFTFNAGNATVTLTDQANGYVIADALMLLPPGAPPNTATWTPNVATAGNYQVYARWTSHPNRATNATYTVSHAAGSTPVTVNQQANGGAWNLLGTYNLAPGTAHNVTLTDQANGFVIADAIRLVLVNTPPTVSISAPAANAVLNLPGPFTLTANAADTDGTVAKVDFYEGATLIGTATSSPYTVQWVNPAPGAYSLTAVATDNANAATASAAVPVTVNLLPTVAITAPAPNAAFSAPASITVTASAADPDGAVTKVDFYEGATLIGTATASPYTIQWTGVAPGSYSLTAIATDNLNTTTASAAVPISVGVARANYFIHVDHLNTPRLIANDQQQVVWRRDNQEPFGDSPPDENPTGLGVFEFDLGFPGQRRDRETGQWYNYQRDCYDPATGRYCQPDPIGLAGGSLSPYAYVYSSPLLLVDPTGEVGIPGLVAGALIGGGAYAIGQVLSGNPISPSGLLVNTLAGGISGASGAYIYAGVAKLGLNSAGSLALNAAANSVVNVALNVPIQLAQNAQQGQCLGNDLDVTIYRSAFYGAAGGYLGARIAGVAPAAAAAAQQYANRMANTLFPKGPAFTATIGPIGSAVAGGVNAASFATGNVVQSAPTLFPNGRP